MTIAVAVVAFGGFSIVHHAHAIGILVAIVGVALVWRWLRSHARYTMVIRREQGGLFIERRGRFFNRIARPYALLKTPLEETQCEAGFEPFDDYVSRWHFDIDEISSIRASVSWWRGTIEICLNDGNVYAATPFRLWRWRATKVAADWENSVAAAAMATSDAAVASSLEDL